MAHTIKIAIKSYLLPRIRAELADAHRKIERGAARAGRPTPSAPVVVVLGTRTARRCSNCGQADPDMARLSCSRDECGIFTMRGVEIADVEVSGDRPALDGWELIACVEPIAGTGENLVARVPGSTDMDLSSYRTADMARCDHCEARRGRTETFVVRHEDGQSKIVGRQCLADFLGGKSPADIIARLEWHRIVEACADEDGGSGGGRGPQVVIPIDWCTTVAAVVRALGWMSATRARALSGPNGEGPPSTADVAASLTWIPWLGGDERAKREFRELQAKCAANAQDVARATEALAWAKTCSDGTDEYLANLSALARGSWIERGRMTAILASIFAAWGRATGTVIPGVQLTESRDRAASQYCGEVKQEIKAAVVVEKVIQIDGQYGTSYLHVMRGAIDGNRFKWFSSKKSLGDGWQGWLIGNVKAHEEYKGERGTVLTRCVETASEGVPALADASGKACDWIPYVKDKPAKKPRAPRAKKPAKTEIAWEVFDRVTFPSSSESRNPTWYVGTIRAITPGEKAPIAYVEVDGYPGTMCVVSPSLLRRAIDDRGPLPACGHASCSADPDAADPGCLRAGERYPSAQDPAWQEAK